IESTQHLAGLRRRAVVRLIDRDLLAGALGVLFDELLIQLPPEFAGRIVGDVEQTAGIAGLGVPVGEAHAGEGAGEADQNGGKGPWKGTLGAEHEPEAQANASSGQSPPLYRKYSSRSAR